MSLITLLRGLFRKSAPAAPAVPPIPAVVPTAPQLITADLLIRLGVNADLAGIWTGPLRVAASRHGINTRLRVAPFVANGLHETMLLKELVESLDYAPEALLKQWPTHFTPALAQQLGRTASHPADQQQIAEHAYGGRMGNGPIGSGDGWRYRGRGLIPLTGKTNYSVFASRIGASLATLPEVLETPGGAAESAAAYWETSACNILADRCNITGIRKVINGGTIGLAEVTALNEAALAILPS